jgi:hypothetical protein
MHGLVVKLVRNFLRNSMSCGKSAAPHICGTLSPGREHIIKRLHSSFSAPQYDNWTFKLLIKVAFVVFKINAGGSPIVMDTAIGLDHLRAPDLRAGKGRSCRSTLPALKRIRCWAGQAPGQA